MTGATEVAAAGVVAAAAVVAADCPTPSDLSAAIMAFAERGVGQVTIKKRGSPLEPDALRQALRLRGDNEAVLFLTQVAGRHTVLIGARG